ncbi:MAG: hypothetical protein ACR2KH_06830 [Sphingomicrobium sp.]
MTTHAQFYLTRAAIARELAQGSQLDNVRESHLRAAEAWDGFAARAMKADLMRAEELKRKAAEADTAEQELPALPLDDPAPRRDSRSAGKSRGLGVF